MLLVTTIPVFAHVHKNILWNVKLLIKNNTNPLQQFLLNNKYFKSQSEHNMPRQKEC